jgi:hypothetical protein
MHTRAVTRQLFHDIFGYFLSIEDGTATTDTRFAQLISRYLDRYVSVLSTMFHDMFVHYLVVRT